MTTAFVKAELRPFIEGDTVMTWRRWLAFCYVALGATLAPQHAHAQAAPTGGHYGARSSDTGFAGGVTSSGGYSTAVPLDLPPVRGGLPVPVGVMYTERGFGAAGLGWDVPLSYIQRDTTFTRRRPVGTASVAPSPREQVSLTLAGSRIDLVRTATAWVGRTDANDIEVRQQSDGSWVAYDGKGLTYTFAVVSSALANSNRWLLTDITGAAGSKVHLDYTIGTPAIAGGTGVSIDLKSASYNPSPVAGETCYKHAVNLNYDSNATAPLSTSLLGTSLLVRLHKLTSIDIVARSTCASSTEIQRKYLLGYLSDTDTRQSRLRSVTMTGRAGTPQASVVLPVATYTYGSVSNGSQLTYRKANTSALGFSPLGNTTLEINGFNTTSLLLDMFGDGRPDQVTTQSDGSLAIKWNTSAVDKISFGATSLMNPGLPPELVSPNGASREMTWDQVIDFNGDGRMDIVTAGEAQGFWTVYLNTPDPALPWRRLSFSIADLAQQLRDRGMTVVGNWLPLSQRYSSGEFVQDPSLCWQYSIFDGWLRAPEDDETCQNNAPLFGELHNMTIVEWELKDINGDGYPDVVFNSTPARLGRRQTPFPTNPRDGEERLQTLVSVPRLGSPNRIDAVLNVIGTHLGGMTQAFSAPITLVSNDSCGVAQWISSDATSYSFRNQICGLEDVNGDGIVDHVIDRSVFLGKGTTSTGGWFTSGAMITLPGALAIHQNSPNPSCSVPGAVAYSASETAALRDVTGDGIPDYVTKDGSGASAVRVGTGTAFSSPLGVAGTFELSLQTERCDGTNSATLAGLFDIDGDGKPDVVSDDQVWSVVGPSGATGAPEAGRLTRIDNGYGAQTNIHYRSIKADPGTHQVPFPEVVVDVVSTSGTRGQGGDLSAMNYAYDQAELVFDPAADAFRFLGYGRRLELPTPVSQPAGVGSLVITDYYRQFSAVDPYDLKHNVLDRDARYALRARFGRVSDITVLSGNFGATALANPAQLLSLDVTTDSRRIGHAHYDWNAKLLADASDPAGAEPCLESVYPYNYPSSQSYAADSTNNAYDAFTAHGFAYVASVDTLRGQAGASSPPDANVESRTDVVTIDSRGRPTRVKYANDVHRSEEDVCVVTTYAEPPSGANERIFFAPASRSVSACDSDKIYASETWEYDGQSAGNIGAGLVTSHSVDRLDDTGTLLATIRQFDATYDAAGNPKTVTTTRSADGASRTVRVDYDVFGLAPTATTVTPSVGPSLQTTIARDPISLNAIAVTEPNGTRYGTVFDGFQRVTQSTITPQGGALGAFSKSQFFGFSTTAPAGECVAGKTLRCVVTTVFTDAVDPSQVGTAAGRTSTTFFDELGRQFRSEVKLGAKYDNKKLVVTSRTYDGLGRVLVEREPFAIAEGDFDARTYATTYYFNADGTPSCFVRGTEMQPYTETSDEANQIFPTCFRRSFENNTEVVSVKDAASLLSHSPQDGVEHRSYVTASGRTIRRSTWQGSTRLEHAEFSYDLLGHRTGMTRYKDADAGALPVTSSWHFDSLGQMTELDEPDSVPQLNTYSDWGELLQTSRRVTSAGGTQITRSVVKQYDALGRLTHSEEQTDGVADPDTLYDYLYDDGVNIAPQVTPTNVRGRLAQASSPTGSVSFSYDALGQTNARVFTDPQGGTYVEQRTWHADGSLSALDLFLPDTAYAREHVDYTYDTAGRSSSVKYSGADHQDLFTDPTTDPLGRIRAATFGQATYSTDYYPTGRQLLKQVVVSSLLGSRTYNFSDYDPLGRERSRSEVKDGVTKMTNSAYDALGRLSSSLQVAGSTTQFDQHFTYDALGNMLTRTDAAPSPGLPNTTLGYLDGTHDRDRICRIAFGGDTHTDCNVTYDEVGSITSQPTPTGSRQYTYYLDGSVRTVTDDHGSTAHFRYDALGGMQTLDLTSSVSADQRNDVHYGDLFTVRNAKTSNEFITRAIPGPAGSVASRRGAGGPWVFEFGEARGNRFFVDDHGAFVQDVDYDSFGAPTSTGTQPANRLYSSTQWNGGDALAAFGISQLGARVYDPAIGRFLSRDPLLTTATAATGNPYAFALNDPVNYSDPSGLQGEPNTGGSSGDFTTFYSPTAFSDLFPLASPIDSLAEAQRHIASKQTPTGVSAEIGYADTFPAGAGRGSRDPAAPSDFVPAGDEPAALFLIGIVDNVVDLGTAVRHPIRTLHNINEAAKGPHGIFRALPADVGLTFAIGLAIHKDLSDCVHGGSRACGHIAGMAITLPVGGEVLSEVSNVAKAAKVGRLVEEGAAAANAVTEGIYEFPEAAGQYVGQSGNLPSRIGQHLSSGRAASEGAVTVKEVLGGKTAREIAEHNRIQEITGGTPARQSGKVTNKVDPIGPKRSHLLKKP